MFYNISFRFLTHEMRLLASARTLDWNSAAATMRNVSCLFIYDLDKFLRFQKSDFAI